MLGIAAAFGLPISAFAADYAEPAAFAPENSARPIAAQVSDASPDQPLRWKAKSAAPAQATAADNGQFAAPRYASSPSPAPAARGWNRTRIDGSVRPAQAVSDPFDDPFGDRGATRQATDLQLVPTASESAGAVSPSYEELPAPTPLPVRSPAPFAAPANGPAIPEFIVQPYSGLPASPTPESGIPMPSVDLLPGGRGSPCDRVYNDRNCCDIESGCRTFRQQLLSDSLRSISLDITPRYMPELSLAEDEAARTEAFKRELASRSWRGKNGEVLATGRMTNLIDGRVIVVNDAGNVVGRIPWNQLGDDELCYINAWWRLPVECALGGREVVSRSWIPSSYQWHASALCHKPLYFEEVQLERYGHTAGPIRQPIISGAHFFLNLAALPYHMAYQPPHECQYALGYYRPGSCAPWMIPPIPLSLKGALAETGFIIGGIYVLP